MRITKREILFSVIILSLGFSLGILLFRPIYNSLTTGALKTIEKVQVKKDTSEFDYISRTDVGDFLAEGELSAIDPVSLDIPGKYLEILKKTEKYTAHIRTYTVTDGKGHTSVRTRTEYTWDEIEKERKVTDSIRFLGKRFSLQDISFRHSVEKDTIIYKKERMFGACVGDIRYVYYTYPESVSGVMSGTVEEREFLGLGFTRGQEIDKIISRAERKIKSTPWIYWILWTLMVLGGIIGFVYLENDWLEDKEE